MTDESSDRQTRERLLRDAVDRQTRLRLEATVGHGCDRHLLGLTLAAQELGIDLPAVFTGKVSDNKLYKFIKNTTFYLKRLLTFRQSLLPSSDKNDCPPGVAAADSKSCITY